jgi:hypothetical protein
VVIKRISNKFKRLVYIIFIIYFLKFRLERVYSLWIYFFLIVLGVRAKFVDTHTYDFYYFFF